MRTARGSEAPDQLAPAAEFDGMRLEPARRQINVGDRGRVAVLRRHAEINRQHDDAALGERLVERRVVEPITRGPGAAMDVHERRKWTGPSWPIEAGQQRHPIRPLVFEVAYLDVKTLLDHDFVCHRPPPTSSISMPAGGLRSKQDRPRLNDTRARGRGLSGPQAGQTSTSWAAGARALSANRFRSSCPCT